MLCRAFGVFWKNNQRYFSDATLYFNRLILYAIHVPNDRYILNDRMEQHILA